MRKPAAVATRRIRCAIYTRKSTEDGLEQEFNSLDAQREACAAYIASQRHEGWVAVRDSYDDGGFSGGNMGRPGLQRLLADVAGGQVDVIVIYKVDRLTRSLADFAKIVDVLDAAKASFVSVTQSFNTTTSMGRLTLNMLLSFAQFEREVTGERIRDKIAASKRKGLWMGGPVPLGYDVAERKLVVNEAEAELVRTIMQRYLELGSVAELAASINAEGHRTKMQHRTSGPHKGGCHFRRGTLYHLLSNRIYLGEIVHKGTAHPGEHAAIVDMDLWRAVQAKLAANGPGQLPQRAARRLPLAGLLYDGLGRPMSSSHATKGQRRYRYYVSRHASEAKPAWRVSASDVEQLVVGELRRFLTNRSAIARLAADVDAAKVQLCVSAAQWRADRSDILQHLSELGLHRVDIHGDEMVLKLAPMVLLQTLGMTEEGELEAVQLRTSIERVRRGHQIRLLIPGADAETPIEPNPALVKLLGQAMDARELVLTRPDHSLQQIAAAEGRCRKRLGKLVRLSCLAPELVNGIVRGQQPCSLTPRGLIEMDLPLAWTKQAELFATL